MIEKLQSKIGQAGVMDLKDGTKANYGGIKVDGEHFLHYTGLGLREIFTEKTEKSKQLENTDVATLLASGHVARTLISDIVAIS